MRVYAIYWAKTVGMSVVTFALFYGFLHFDWGLHAFHFGAKKLLVYDFKEVIGATWKLFI